MNLLRKLRQFDNKNVLLLQGPVGNFFYKISKILRKSNVYKINFNGGDFFFYPFKSINYTDDFNNLEKFYEKIFIEKNIQILIMYNDCRKIHELAIKVAKKMNIEIWIFEEGYIRPYCITFEKDGVNANSKISKDKDFFIKNNFNYTQKIKAINGGFKNMAFNSFLYWLFSFLLSFYFNNKNHHRSLSPFEMFAWFLSLYRKYLYKITEKNINKKISNLKNKYFLAILQVYNDTQITHHYGKSIEDFIKETIISFSNNARAKSYLIFKHHPMDRGYKNYQKLINDLSIKYNVEGRIFYVHDSYLPSILSNALGCIVINSTVGFSALYHNCPLKVCGNAFYDIEGLTYQKSLDFFWKEAHANRPNQKIFKNLKNYLLLTSQANVSFYKNKF